MHAASGFHVIAHGEQLTKHVLEIAGHRDLFHRKLDLTIFHQNPAAPRE